MTKTKIFTIIGIVVVLGLGFQLYKIIKDPIEQDKQIAAAEAKVIERLKLIRKAQMAYFGEKGKYAASWDSLFQFVNQGYFSLVQRREIEIKDDSFRVEYDTLGRIPAKDSLFPAKKYPNFKVEELAIIPESNGKKFDIFAGQIRKGDVWVEVFEVRDIFPINPKRGATFEIEKRKEVPVRIAKLEKEIQQLQQNVKIIQLRMEPTEKEMAPTLKEIEAINEKINALKAKNANDPGIDDLKSQKETLEEKLEPYEDKLKPYRKDLDKYAKQLTEFNNLVEMLKNKPLRVGSRDEVTTAGNWE